MQFCDHRSKNISPKLPGHRSFLRQHRNAPSFLDVFYLLRWKTRSTTPVSLRSNSPTTRQLFSFPFSECHDCFAVHSAVQNQLFTWRQQESRPNIFTRTVNHFVSELWIVWSTYCRSIVEASRQPYLLFAVWWDGQSTIRLEQFQETGKKRKVACPQIGRQYWRLD